MPSLFRPEALRHREREWLGSIQLLRPVSFTWLTLLVVATACAVAAFMTFGQYTRKARVAGYLAPDLGVIRLVSPQAAVVVESHAEEGRTVRRGDVLFVLAVGQATLAGDAQAAVEASLAARERILQATIQQQAELAQAELAAVDRQLADLRREVASNGTEAALQAERMRLAQESLSRLESLRNDNFVSSAQVQNKAEEILGLKVQAQALDRQHATQQRQISALESQRAEIPLRNQVRQGETQRELASLAQQSAENEARRRIVVRAPQDGVVTGVLAEPGQSVGSTVALASLVPSNARLDAHLFAPSSAVGFVRPGEAVVLRYQAFPYQKFGHQMGEVTQVSRSPLQAPELAGLSLPRGSGEPLYRITVRLDRQSVAAYGQAQPLVPGMQLEADVLLDRRRLIEWIFEPVLSLAGRV